MFRWLGTFVGVFWASFALAQDAPKMNVLFIVSDDLTNNAMGCYQSVKGQTPNLDKLASKGVRFDRAYCQFPLCNPSRASFLTGLRPDTLRLYENATQFRKLKPDVQSLPQSFQKAGYSVTRVGKLYHYGVPGDIGTDGLDDPPSWGHVINPKGRDKTDEEKIFTLTPMAKGSGRFGGTLSWLAADGADAEQTDGLIAKEVSQLLTNHKDKPFFLACGFFRPHTPYVAPKAYFDKYPKDKFDLPKVPEGHREAGPTAAFGSAKPEQEKMTDEQRREALQAYHASTTFMDRQVGLVLEALEAAKLADKTIVVFFSDHGYHLGEHGLWQKMSLFENSARVPLLIYDPRAKANGQASTRPVELVDLHATLTDLCGIAAPKTDGQSLKPLLDNPKAEWKKPAITQVTRGNLNMKPGGKGQAPFMGYSVRAEQFRYIEWDGGAKGTQLYDLQADPQELKNLASDPAFADKVAELKKLLPPAVKLAK
jgi:iduronate 2-sulfatase